MKPDQNQVVKAAMVLLGLSGPGDTVGFLVEWIDSHWEEITMVGPTLAQQARYAADAFTLETS